MNIKIFQIFKIFIINIAIILVLGEVILHYIYTPKALSYRMKINSHLENQKLKSKFFFEKDNLRFKPKSTRYLVHPEYSIKTTHDSLGFRNPCYEDINRNTKELFIGDSFVYGIGLSDNFTYGCQLKENGLSAYTIGIESTKVADYINILKKNLTNVKSKFPNLENLNLILFLGNDFESLLNYSSVFENKIEVKTERSSFNILLSKINFFLINNKYLKKSYTLNAIKLLLKPILAPSDKGNYVNNHNGIRFWKKNISKPTQHLVKNFIVLKKDLSNLGLKLKNIYLIEDPSALDFIRLRNDMKLAGFDHNELNVRFKIDAIIEVCKILSINCMDTTSFLQVKHHYYKYDNHLRDSGSEVLAKFIVNFDKDYELNYK